MSFDGSASSDPDGTISLYYWVFEDVTMSGVRVQKTFERAGSYTVSLRVIDNDGLSHQTEPSTIQVSEPNLPPVMVGNQSFSVVENNSLSITLNGAN